MKRVRVTGVRTVRALVAAWTLGAMGVGAGAGSALAGDDGFAPRVPEVVWDSASGGIAGDASGSMPVGNGVVALNVWMENGTGDVLFYIARSDALDENARFLKLGRVRVHVERAGGGAAGGHLVQRAIPALGRLEFEKDGVKFEVFVDAAAPVVHVRGEAKESLNVTASIECWRNERREISGAGPQPERNASWTMHAGGAGGDDPSVHLFESADVFVPAGESGAAVEWYHRNEESCVPFTLKHQSIDGLPGAFDPLTHNTFGGRMEGKGFVRSGEREIRASGVKTFDVRVASHAGVTATAGEWRAGLRREAEKSVDGAAAAARTVAYWKEFWERSSVQAHDASGDADGLARAYTLQRYVTACQGRRALPIKFNGGLFTVEPKFSGPGHNADWRAWGDGYWWQNTRHMYYSMMASGDVEMTDPLFAMYERVRPLCEARSKAYYGAEGAYFPETMSMFGSYSNGDYGWQRAGHAPGEILCPWWDDAWNQGLELVGLMLDRWDYTRDKEFLRGRAIPMAESVLRYFDTRFKKDAGGRIVLDPTQVVETYWDGVVNDMPATAGLRSVTERLCALPSGLVGGKQRAFFERMKSAAPELPIELAPEAKTGLTRTRLAPAEKYNPRAITNCENGELYAVWPFGLVRLGREELLPEALSAWRNRHNDLKVGWGYDGNVAALLGLTEECVRIQKAKVNNSHKAYRWPTTWGPNFDWLPDQNHGGNLMEMTDLMLMQADSIEAGGKIRLLPAWPKAWDVKFRLWAPGKTVVECEVRGGKVVKLEVTPSGRRKDVVMEE